MSAAVASPASHPVGATGLAGQRRSRAARHPITTTVTGRELAAHRLLMGVARTALASAMGVHHYRLAAAEKSGRALDARKAERWHAALVQTAQRKLDALASQGFTFDELPEPMREIFNLYLS